ncbi:MAG: ParB/RepB/Spo0J family partition protein [Puniceicoccales bacterium]|jgi:ParB family chromosome partitioning protein|nr:ParB/RepB/Spo0J family partition protein [Puniceicoccales bacterium]
MSTQRKNLGRGLGSLISGNSKSLTKPATHSTAKETTPNQAAHAPAPTQVVSPFQEVPVGKIVPARWQARREFDDKTLAELAESIQSEGLLQPIVVRSTPDGYELIAGERRWRAFQKLGLKTIPARIVTASDAASAAMTLIENLQREGLNPVEEALGFASLMRDFNLTQEAVAERVGKPRATIANSVRLLTLDREIHGYIASGLLSSGHAKVILGLETPADRTLVARRIVEISASVREAETIVKNIRNAKPSPTHVARGERNASDNRSAAAVTTAVANIEKRLVTRLNTRVQIRHGARQGRILIEYYGNDDLQRILEKLGMGME